MSTLFTRETLLRWLLAFGCFAIVLFFFSPSWGAFALWARVPEMSGMLEVRRGVSVLAQVAHPGAEIADPLHRVIQWRLLFPLIGRVLNLSPAMLFSLADIGAIVVVAYLVSLLRRQNTRWLPTALAAVALSAASWLFVSTGWLGYYDSWLALALLVVAFSPRPWVAWAACVWAPWIDERFVMAAPLALYCRWLWQTMAWVQPDENIASPARAERRVPGFNLRRDLGVPAILLAAFVFVRLGVLSGSSAANATVTGYMTAGNYLNAPLSRIVLGIWEGLRAGWMFVVAAVLLLRSRPIHAATLGIAVLLMVVLGLATAQDYSRSMTMLLPVAVLGALLWLRNRERPVAASVSATRYMIGAVAVTLILPAHHVMNDTVNPIFYFYHELAAMESPPPTAMPELRELHAIHLMEQGQYAEAEQELTMAIKLSDNPAGPAKQRGMLYASARRWEDAKRDFTLVVQNDPDNPDGWFLRAQIELALRDNDAARSDYEHARAIAPAGWNDRPDVKRFSALFQQQAGQR